MIGNPFLELMRSLAGGVTSGTDRSSPAAWAGRSRPSARERKVVERIYRRQAVDLKFKNQGFLCN